MSTPFTIRFPVRFRDVDVLGHVNNAVYFTYMESARAEYWMHLFRPDDITKLRFIVARAECDFKIPARYGDEIEVSIQTSSVGNSSFVWEYEIRRPGSSKIFALGKTIQVFYDYDTLESSPVPPEVRDRLLS